MSIRINDSTWVRRAFGLTWMARDRRNASAPRTTADFKFGDTTFGGSPAINAASQSCRFADLKATGLLADPDLRKASKSGNLFENENNSGSFRLGRRYSEIIDDNAHYVHMRFGIPKYTGAIAFFANMYDRDAGRLAKTGEYSTIMRDLGGVVGLAAMFVLLPFAVIVPLVLCSQVLKFTLGSKPSRYYYLKPTPHLYLQAVQAMADTHLLHYRLLPMWEPFNSDRYNEIGDANNRLTPYIDEAYSMLPDIWKSNGKFDVYKAMNRYQTLANYQSKTIETIYAGAKSKEELDAKIALYVKNAKYTAMMRDQVNGDELSLATLSSLYSNNPLYQVSAKDEKAEAEAWKAIQNRFSSEHGVSADGIVNEQEQATAIQNTQSDVVAPEDQTNETFWEGLTDFFSDVAEQTGSELMDGGQWVTFKVQAKGEVSDSFTNSSREPEIASTLNSLTSKAKSLDVSFSGGKTGFDFVDEATAGIKNFIGGALDAVNLTGLSAIYGTAFVDIPEVWEASQANIATESITIDLASPYGNDMALFQKIALPLDFILAGVLPMATGKQSHTHPFLCEMYSRGRTNIRLGMIDSVNITRGTGNMGWRVDGKMLACRVTINVKDLSKVMAMPLIRDPSIFDDHNTYTDYMATLGGASLHSMTYEMDRLVFNLNKFTQSWKSAFMSGRIASTVNNSLIGRMGSAFTAGVGKS